MPLPPGKVVRSPDLTGMTELEKQAIQKEGWQAGQAIPENIQKQLADILAAEKPYVPAAGVAAVSLDTVDISELPPEQQLEKARELQNMLARHPFEQAPKPAETPAAPAPLDIPITSEVAQKIASAEQLDVQLEEPERAADGYIPRMLREPTAEASSATQEPKQSDPESGSGMFDLTHCPQCAWDLTMPSIPEPDDVDKLLFLHSLLGEQLFKKTYSSMAGAVTFEFRTLTTQELDAIFAQVYREANSGVVSTQQDYLERVNRYRLYLQLQAVKLKDDQTTLVDGLSRETNPRADSYWITNPGEEKLPAIEKYILGNVLHNETLCRLARRQLATFNRLVLKMEAMVDNADFWAGIAD